MTTPTAVPPMTSNEAVALELGRLLADTYVRSPSRRRAICSERDRSGVPLAPSAVRGAVHGASWRPT